MKKSNADLFSSSPGAGSEKGNKVAWSNVIEAAHSMEANEKAIDNVQVMPCHLLPTSIDAFSDREARGHVPHQNVRSGHIHAVSHPRTINSDQADV